MAINILFVVCEKYELLIKVFDRMPFISKKQGVCVLKNKTLAKILSVATSGVMLFSAGSVYLSHSERNQDGTYNVSEENREELLGISDENEYFLGAASHFSVFLHDDFAEYCSDCEGRLAAGGNANVGDPVSYSVGARLPEGFSAAQIVVGGDTLTNFQPENKKFVVGSKGNISPEILNHMNDGQTEVYIGKLIQGKYRKVNYKNKKVVPTEKSSWYIKEDNHEAIISEECFEKVREEMKKRRYKHENSGGKGERLPYAVVCGICAERFEKISGEKLLCGKCGGSHRGNGCPLHNMGTKETERAVREKIKENRRKNADIIKRVYEDMAAGKICRETGEEIIKRCDSEIEKSTEKNVKEVVVKKGEIFLIYL